jgi:hypothetical protein
MGTVSTNRVLNEAWVIENHENAGSFWCMSRDTSQQVSVTIISNNPLGREGVELVHAGDAVTIPLSGIQQIVIEAASYPTTVAVNFTTLGLILSAAPFLAGNDPSNPLHVTGFPTILSVDPSAGAGVAADVGSIAGRDNAGAGELWLKTSAPNTGWTRVTVP